MTTTPAEFEPELKTARVFYEVGGSEGYTTYEDIDAVVREDQQLKIILGKDCGGDRRRFVYYPIQKVLSWKVIDCNGESAQE